MASDVTCVMHNMCIQSTQYTTTIKGRIKDINKGIRCKLVFTCNIPRMLRLCDRITKKLEEVRSLPNVCKFVIDKVSFSEVG